MLRGRGHAEHGEGAGSGTAWVSASRNACLATIIPPHRDIPLREGMTVTIGHTILAIPGFGGVRHEDVYRVTPAGGEILVPYPIDPVITV